MLVASMGKTKAEKYLKGFTEDDRELLVRIVKVSQGRNIRGTKGDWKAFLNVTDKKNAVISDPAKHPWKRLAQFVHTLTSHDGIEMVKEMRFWQKRQKRYEELAASLWKSSHEQDLVQLTFQHCRYKEYYALPTYEEGWVITDDKKGESSPEDMLSIDCEMVNCEGGKELARVCVVNRADEVLLDMLVKPVSPVINYLTPITGICAEDMDNATCYFGDAQAAVLDLLTSSTFLVGHSLHNDLKALKIDHLRVIDTAFIFEYHNKPDNYNVGLMDLCKSILGYEFREDGKPHNCIDDARIPMQIVLHTLAHGLNSPIDIISTKAMSAEDLSKLFFHSIPISITERDLLKILPEGSLCKIEPIRWVKSKHGSTFGLFESPDEANRVFEQLIGEHGQDSHGRPQKTVCLNEEMSFASFKVRKMWSGDGVDCHGDVHHMEITSGSKVPVDSNGKKKRKIMDASGVDEENGHCCKHLQELGIVKEQLKEKIEEVQSLQRIILGLAQKKD